MGLTRLLYGMYWRILTLSFSGRSGNFLSTFGLLTGLLASSSSFDSESEGMRMRLDLYGMYGMRDRETLSSEKLMA